MQKSDLPPAAPRRGRNWRDLVFASNNDCYLHIADGAEFIPLYRIIIIRIIVFFVQNLLLFDRNFTSAQNLLFLYTWNLHWTELTLNLYTEKVIFPHLI